jgi:flagellar biosynthesis protein FlhF
VKIKKFAAATEQEAIEKIKEELGDKALVINVRRGQPRGFFAFLRKPFVEVTAAYDDDSDRETLEDLARVQAESKFAEDLSAAAFGMGIPESGISSTSIPGPSLSATSISAAGMSVIGEKSLAGTSGAEIAAIAAMEAQINEKDERIKLLSDMLLTTGDMLSRAQKQMSVARHDITTDRQRLYQNNLLQVFYDTLVENQVSAQIAQEILDDLDGPSINPALGAKLADHTINNEINNKLDINFIVKIVYNSLVRLIGSPEVLEARESKGNPQKFAFIGPTGVGKTTTIAKLTADLYLNRGLDVALITADTYRIAAIEQLKTYGDILGIEVAVAYKPEELRAHSEEANDISDFILVDTAGRSHKNRDNLLELNEFLSSVPGLEVFLVLSLTTKYEDMLNIVDTFSQICDFRIIFTKMDETDKLGAIVNICYHTGKRLSYITFGQNVPDDIKTLAPGEVAMRLLGLGEDD